MGQEPDDDAVEEPLDDVEEEDIRLLLEAPGANEDQLEDSDKRFPLVVYNVDWTVVEESTEAGLGVLEGCMVRVTEIDVRSADHVLSHAFLVNHKIAQDLVEVRKCLKQV